MNNIKRQIVDKNTILWYNSIVSNQLKLTINPSKYTGLIYYIIQKDGVFII